MPKSYSHVLSAIRGFTLIELLVVIATVAMLLAILVPSLSKARIQAQQTACGSNLRQVGVAIWAYANDFGMYAPVDDSNLPDENGMPATGQGTNGGKWAWMLTSYLNHNPADSNAQWNTNPQSKYVMRRVKLYQCPSTWTRLNTWNFNSYGANPFIMNLTNRAVLHLKRDYAYRLTSPAAIRRSTQTLMISESLAANNVTTVWQGARVIQFVHNQVSNTLLLDGHVEVLATNAPGYPYFLTTTSGTGTPGTPGEVWGPLYADPNP